VLSSRVESPETRGLLGLIRMGVVTERIADAAAEIAEVVLRGGEPHPILSMVIQDAEETVETAELNEGSSLAGKTLKEVRIPEETGMWVLVVKRGERWIRPRPELVLKVGDVIIASGYAEGEADFQGLVSGKPPARD